MCGGNNGRLFSLLAIKIHPTTNKKREKGKRLEIVWWREEEEGRWCIQKSFAGDLYVADGSEWEAFFPIHLEVCVYILSFPLSPVCVFGLCIVKLSLLAQQPSTIRQPIIVYIGKGGACLDEIHHLFPFQSARRFPCNSPTQIFCFFKEEQEICFSLSHSPEVLF
jgi:hypothetical protein